MIQLDTNNLEKAIYVGREVGVYYSLEVQLGGILIGDLNVEVSVGN